MNLEQLSAESFEAIARHVVKKAMPNLPDEFLMHGFMSNPTMNMQVLNVLKPDLCWNERADKCEVTFYNEDGIACTQTGKDIAEAMYKAIVAHHLANGGEVLEGEKIREEETETGVSFDEIFQHCNSIAEQNKLHTVWSIYNYYGDKENFADYKTMFDRPAAEINRDGTVVPTTVKYDGGWGKKGSVKLPKNPTWLDLWKAADELITKSGDNHHIYIELFNIDKTNPAVLHITCGS